MASDKVLVSMINEIEAVRLEADLDLEQIPLSVRSGFGIRKADGAIKLKELTKKYNDIVSARTATISLSGPTDLQLQFAALAESEGGTLTVDCQAAYIALSERIFPSIGAHGQIGITQISHLVKGLEDIASKTGLFHVNTPNPVDILVVNDMAALVSAVKHLVESQVDSNLGKRYNEAVVLEKALSSQSAERVVPIVITDTYQLGHSDSLFGATVDVEVKLVEVTKEVVLNAFKKLQNQLKSKNNKEN